MKSFQHKRGFRNIIQSKPVLVFLVIVVVIFIFGVFSFMGKMRVVIENKEIVENKVLELENKKEQLSSDIERLKSQDGIEKSIREKFGLAKEGEGLIVIVEDKNEQKVTDTPSRGFFSFLFFWENWFK